MSDRARRFRAALERDGLEYRHVEPPETDRAHIRFTGNFQGEEIIWDAVIVTLARDYRNRYPSGVRHAGDFSLPQHIEIGPDTDTGRRLEIGLNVPCIDAATLHKTIIMIRNYKRLHPGRHEYAPAWKPE